MCISRIQFGERRRGEELGIFSSSRKLGIFRSDSKVWLVVLICRMPASNFNRDVKFGSITAFARTGTHQLSWSHLWSHWVPTHKSTQMFSLGLKHLSRFDREWSFSLNNKQAIMRYSPKKYKHVLFQNFSSILDDLGRFFI